jgi:NAD(P)-dependent dehydrogenase (short-subunit alcohol dehydrogenase family)
MKETKVAIVTGGGSGIGRGICQRLGEEGYFVVAADINESSAAETIQMIRSDHDGGDAPGTGVAVDLTRKESVQSMVRTVLERTGRIDVLVNCAGMVTKEYIWELAEESWDRTMDLNMKGVYLCTQAVVDHMKERGYGRIVNISSIAGKTGEERTGSYCASKFGVIGLTQSVALEVAPYGITCNAVCPSAVETDLVKKWISGDAARSGRSYEEELHEQITRFNPVGRIAQVEDVAHAVAFLADERSGFITGTTLNVAGGREMH